MNFVPGKCIDKVKDPRGNWNKILLKSYCPIVGAGASSNKISAAFQTLPVLEVIVNSWG